MKRSFRLSFKALRITAAGAVLNVSFMLIAFLGVMHGMAGAAGVIITTLSPIITILLSALFFAQPIRTVQVVGLGVGLLGGAVMLEVWHLDPAVIFDGGNGYFLLCAFIWAGVTIFSHRSHLHIDPFVYSFVLSGIASAILFVLAWPKAIGVVFDQNAAFWTALIYISFFGQTIATTIYYYASGKLGSGSASAFMFIVPLSALLLSWLILGEVPAPALVAGGAISVFAVYLITKKAGS
jgi:drug/metabolite transporter (DMT)-like permease